MDSEQPARMPPLQVNGNTGGGPSLSETQGGGFSAGEPLNSSSAVPVASLKRKADSLSGEVEPQVGRVRTCVKSGECVLQSSLRGVIIAQSVVLARCKRSLARGFVVLQLQQRVTTI